MSSIFIYNIYEKVYNIHSTQNSVGISIPDIFNIALDKSYYENNNQILLTFDSNMLTSDDLIKIYIKSDTSGVSENNHDYLYIKSIAGNLKQTSITLDPTTPPFNNIDSKSDYRILLTCANKGVEKSSTFIFTVFRLHVTDASILQITPSSGSIYIGTNTYNIQSNLGIQPYTASVRYLLNSTGTYSSTVSIFSPENNLDLSSKILNSGISGSFLLPSGNIGYNLSSSQLVTKVTNGVDFASYTQSISTSTLKLDYIDNKYLYIHSGTNKLVLSGSIVNNGILNIINESGVSGYIVFKFLNFPSVLTSTVILDNYRQTGALSNVSIDENRRIKIYSSPGGSYVTSSFTLPVGDQYHIYFTYREFASDSGKGGKPFNLSITTNVYDTVTNTIVNSFSDTIINSTYSSINKIYINFGKFIGSKIYSKGIGGSVELTPEFSNRNIAMCSYKYEYNSFLFTYNVQLGSLIHRGSDFINNQIPPRIINNISFSTASTSTNVNLHLYSASYKIYDLSYSGSFGSASLIYHSTTGSSSPQLYDF